MHHTHHASCPLFPILIILHVLYANGLICLMLKIPHVHYPLCSLCPMIIVPHAQYAPCPITSMPITPNVHYLPCSLCHVFIGSISIMSHAHYVLCSLCLIFIMPLAHYAPCPLCHSIPIAHYVSCPICFCPLCPLGPMPILSDMLHDNSHNYHFPTTIASWHLDDDHCPMLEDNYPISTAS